LKFKTKPFPYQLAEFEEHAKTAARILPWEQGTGKTKVVVDTAAFLYAEGEIDGLLVIAPNGVHRNWVSDEIPTHMPDDVDVLCHTWWSTDAKWHLESYERALKHPGLAVLTMSYNAVMTKRGQTAWKKFLQRRKCLYVLDESQKIKNPGAKVSRRIMPSSKAAAYRRCLSGTPIDNSPFDIYNQLKFLDPEVWNRRGLRTFAAFKMKYGVWETWQTANGAFPKCVAYRNLEDLQEAMSTLGRRITKSEVLRDLPEKLYSKRYVEMTPAQRKAYRTLSDDYMVEFEQGLVTANLAITRLLRFQQIACGYIPTDDGKLQVLPENRLTTLADLCDDLAHKAIIWARFRRDIERISAHPTFQDRCVVVDGSVCGQARGLALESFQSGDVQFLVANPAAIGTGVTLHSAQTVIYYSNSFKLSDRLQSEDRAHRIGTRHAVHYIDMVCSGTVDERIVESLRKKVDVASQITGDKLKEWI